MSFEDTMEQVTADGLSGKGIENLLRKLGHGEKKKPKVKKSYKRGQRRKQADSLGKLRYFAEAKPFVIYIDDKKHVCVVNGKNSVVLNVHEAKNLSNALIDSIEEIKFGELE